MHIVICLQTRRQQPGAADGEACHPRRDAQTQGQEEGAEACSPTSRTKPVSVIVTSQKQAASESSLGRCRKR